MLEAGGGWKRLVEVGGGCCSATTDLLLQASAQRRSLLSALQVEERMQASHAQHLETLRLQLEKQQQQLQLEHSGKVRVERWCTTHPPHPLTRSHDPFRCQSCSGGKSSWS